MRERFDAYGEYDDAPRYNIAPSQPVPSIRQEPSSPHRSFSTMRWGLVPSWAIVRDSLADHWRESYVCRTGKSMKALELAVACKNGCCKIAISLINPWAVGDPAKTKWLPVPSDESSGEDVIVFDRSTISRNWCQFQTGFPLSSRRTNVSFPFTTSRARIRSASPCFTFDPVRVTSSPLLKLMPMSSKKDLGQR